jgi:hypothetical protein
MINIITKRWIPHQPPRTSIYLFWCLESKSNITVETSGFRLFADELDVAVKINALLLLESTFNLKGKIEN